MANTSTSKARSHRSRTKIRSSTNITRAHTSDDLTDLGYFYDTIHGRVAFGELPTEFQSALRAALGSKTLDRLTRISQLGHTSLTYFSATQTRFSHAVGTLLMMNRIFRHLWQEVNFPQALIAGVMQAFPKVFQLCKDKVTCIHCHLLLAALYQDCGELPFQKVTSLYFRPYPDVLDSLKKRLTASSPETWKTKEVFTLIALSTDLETSELLDYDLDFLAFLITGDGCPVTSPLQVFRQMTNGTIDADRLDYVFRDALLTIDSLGDAESVLHSIVRYERDHVVVNDPRPAADFLSTRARLFTFVYASPDVRFRQTLLKSFLQAGFSTEEGRKIFKEEKFQSEVTLPQFLDLDDHSMMQRMRSISKRSDYQHILEPGRIACEALLKTVTNYECRILPKPQTRVPGPAPTKLKALPPDLFFDLLLDQDEEHKLYVPQSVRVEQPLTQDYGSTGEPICLGECSGALGPIFSKENRTPLARNSFFLFRPKARSNKWAEVDKVIRDPILFEAIDREDVGREIANLDDTWHAPHPYIGKKTAISCAFEDRTTIARIIRELQRQGQRYRVLLDSLLGLGNTAWENSRKLIKDAEAVLVVASRTYINSAIEKPDGNIAAEVSEIYAKNDLPKRAQIVVLAVDSFDDLTKDSKWSWTKLNSKWKSGPPILLGPLRYVGETRLQEVVTSAIRELNKANDD